jgi:hypothetical protein
MGAAQSGGGEDKKEGYVWAVGVRNGSILEHSSKYTPVLRARGVLSKVSFFFNINRV